MYEDSTVPEYLPGGGGFSVMKFTLFNLYDMHEKCENWWTSSNDNLPLCRYLGCRLTMYQSENVDYIINYSNSNPFISNKLTYPSCHPFMLLMNKNKIIMPSKQTQPFKKPYKKIFIPPPDTFENKWYFQKEIGNQTLLTLHAAPCSLLHTYIDTNSESNNISIKHLNTTIFTNRDWSNKKWETEHWPYKGSGTTSTYFYRYQGHETTTDKIKICQIVPLTNPLIASDGLTYEEAKIQNPVLKGQHYKNQLLQYRGNIFTKNHFNQQDSVWISTISPPVMFSKVTDDNIESLTIATATPDIHTRSFVELNLPLYTYTRYNPNTDNGTTTKMYLLETNKTGTNYDPPEDDTKLLTGFPMWLNIFGFTDFQIKTGKYIDIWRNYILVIQTHATKPLITTPIVPIDQSFIDNLSPYLKQLDPTDARKWFPQLQYQTQSINDITICGPGIAKLGNRKSEEIKIKYSFYFKWGGNPAKMITVDNPLEQTIFPIPRIEQQTPSLQNPATAFETLLYTFDQRGHQLTETALKRIREHLQTKENLLSITDSTSATALQTLEELLKETSSEKEGQEALLLQLHQQREQQLQLQHRIMELLQLITT